MKWLKILLSFFTWRKDCHSCYYVESVSNHSPCHFCVRGDQYKKRDYDWC